MQTFLPYEDVTKSAQSLDRLRLGKQRVENLQIIRAITDPDYGWQNHPAVNMWRGHETYLYIYHIAIVREWKRRGYKDTTELKFINIMHSMPHKIRHERPAFLGDSDFHISHQSNLIRKNPEYYIPIFGDVPDDLPYVWPGR